MNRERKGYVLALLGLMVVTPFGLLPLVTAADTTVAVAQPQKNAAQKWSAAAPGKVEPREGEYRVAVATLGRIAEVRVKAGNTVQDGEVIVRLDDAELTARLAAAQADAALKKFQRDDQGTTGRLKRRYDADDAVIAAEHKQIAARAALDQAFDNARGKDNQDEVAKAKTALQAAETAITQARRVFADIKAEANEPKTNQYEAGLIAANSQVSAVQALLDQTRIRAPVAGTLLQVGAKIGDTASPSNPKPLAVIGDLSALRVRAELDERDVGRVKVGQKAVVRTDAFRDKEFAATVTSVASGLTAGKISQRGPRRPGEIEILEVLVAFDAVPPLPPGMRVDVYFTAGN